MFSGAAQAVRRFSLLLLEEGELYVEDFVATARWPQGLAGNWQRLPKLPGQLRLCTRSLFFEPDDVRVPIVRLPFQFVEGLEGSGDRRLVLTTSRAVKMRANAADAPYVVAKAVAGGGGGGGSTHAPHSTTHGAAHGPGQHPAGDGAPHLFHWEFELSYARLEAVMPLAQQMMVASRLPPGEADDFLRATLAAAEAGRQFDLGNLRSPGEHILLEMGCTLLSQGALVREPGRLLLTDQRLYFQPLHPISGDAAVSSHPLSAVAAAARRRSSLRDLALEVFFAEPSADGPEGQALAAPPFWAGASALFAFPTREDREQAVNALWAAPVLGSALLGGASAAAACSAILEADPTWLSRVTAAWQRGQLCNLDYLLFLNLASGRSFSDLSQYPVVPWVLSDYSSPALDLSDPAVFRDLSRPVGALNPRRLEMLRGRYREMAGFSPEPPFLYGSHYSTPGFTMFWLVRAAPAHMLRLQNGRFDSPDRLFCSMREAWEGVTSTNPADVKELIPEFYLRHDFLRNLRGLALGTRQSGRAVGDVELPQWAAASPQRFLALHRAALEAPFVSANLHHWIDLIFGHKQRGAAAEAANNVFRHTAYEGAVDLDAVEDPTERLALETQIAEFGQCPRQLFHAKHPQRLVCPPAPEQPAAEEPQSAVDVGAGSSGSQALPLALVATILAAAERGQYESPRLEVPPLLAQLDVMVARRQAEEEAAAAAAAEAAAIVAAAEADEAHDAGIAGSAQGEEPGESGKQQGLAAASSRLKLWAAERTQAVGERLAGSVGAVREAAAAALSNNNGDSEGSERRSAGSTSRLQSLFRRQGSASSSAADVAAAAEAASAAAQGPATAAQQPGRTPPQSPAGRVAAGLVGSIGGRLAALRAQQPPASPPPAAPAIDAPAASSQDSQPEPSAEAASAAAPAPVNPPAFWKFAGRRAQPGGTAAIEDSSDEEAEEQLGLPAAQARQQPAAAGTQQQPTDSSSAAQQQEVQPAGSKDATASGPRSSAELLEAQRQRMLRHSLGEAASTAAAPVPAARLGSSGAASAGWYGPGLRDRLSPGRVLVAGSESVNGCALAAVGQQLFVYSASHSGALRVHKLDSGEQIRSINLCEQPLTSVALLQPASTSGGSGGRHPLALCGAFDARVHAYSADTGRQLGSFQAAGDAVACVQVVGGAGGSSRLLTAAWDGSLKLWEAAEGREPWAASFAQPLSSAAAPSGVWALAASPEDHTVIAGTEDGVVAAWDWRQPPRAPLWQLQLVADGGYVGGLALCPSGTAAVAAAADGSLSLLDLRRSGEVAASVVPAGAPLRCCTTDGQVAMAGDEGGALHLWDISAQLGQAAVPRSGAWTPPDPAGLFLPPLAAQPQSAINALAVAPHPGTAAGVALVTAHEGGLLRMYTA